MSSVDHHPAKDDRSVSRFVRDPLTVVDAVGRMIARAGAGDNGAGYERALTVVADVYDASMIIVIRFAADGADVTELWAKGHLSRDAGIHLDNDLLPVDSPVRSTRSPMVFRADAFGEHFEKLLHSFGPNESLFVAPIVDGEDVAGALAILSPVVGSLDDSDQIAIQLCGELLWRHIRHQEAASELQERAEVAEILAHLGGRLQEGGISEARELMDEVFATVGGRVGADLVVSYERSGATAVPVIRWPSGTGLGDDEEIVLSDEDWRTLDTNSVLAFDPSAPSRLGSTLAGGHQAGVVVAVSVDGDAAAMVALARADGRPLRTPHVELITSAVSLLGQFRRRMGAELGLVRRGIVDQARTEIAEAFLNATAVDIDRSVRAALERIGEVFGSRRVRWIEIDDSERHATLVLEWADGSRPDAPTVWEPGGSLSSVHGGQREPFVLDPEMIAKFSGVVTTSSTLVVPAVVGNDVLAALTLTADDLPPIPDDERRALGDLAGLVHQVRQRAKQEAAAERRQALDDLQLRLAGRFLDRTVVDPGEVLDWALAEMGSVFGADLAGFAEHVKAGKNDTRWWTRDPAADRATRSMDGADGVFSEHFQAILDSGVPRPIRSRYLPDELRASAERLVGSDFSMLVVPLRAPGVALLLGMAVLRDREWSPAEISTLQQIIGQIRQFIDVHASRTQLEYDASHDALTGLANRRKMTEEFIARTARGRSAAVLMIDVDRFKVVNDSLGHSAGDAVLVAIADRIRGSVRDSDLVGRFGGDEFAVMVSDGATEMELASSAARLIDVIREPVIVRGTTVIPTCSIGLAIAGPDDDVETVFRHADAALYDAKEKGRDRYEFFDEDHRQLLRDRLALESGLRRGVRDEEFVAWFQPEYDLIDGQIVGVEALVRWAHPRHGVLDAYRFIDEAEEIGLAPELSRLVLRSSLATMRGWIDTGFHTAVRVNIAAAQLQTTDLAFQIADALEEFAIPPDRLCVEITERSLMLDLDSAVSVLGKVRDLGVQVAVDDFGTGFSSLARLKHLPVDTLKIDRSFVNGIVSSVTDREIVRTIIGLSQGLGLDVVAEGVEHAAQVDTLVALGCHRAQGWYWSPAVPADDVARLARV